MNDQALEDLVTGADIARRLGVTRQRIGQLAATDGFPPPLGRLGNYVVWRWAPVAEWATRTGRLSTATQKAPSDG